MRLLMIGSGSYKGGLTVHRLLAFARELGRRDYDVSVVVPSADKYNSYTPEKHARVEGIKLVQPWQFATRNDLVNLMPYLFTALAACLRARPQLIYMFKPTPISIVGLVPKCLFRVPLVLDIDDMGSEVMRLQNQAGLQVRLVAMCERLALRSADAVVVASTYLETIVKEQYPNKPVLVLSNGVEPGAKPAEITELHDTVYYYGALNRLDLIETLLRSLPTVFKQAPGAKAVIIGGGSALDDAKALVQSLGIAHQVTFTGWIRAEDLEEELSKYVQVGDVGICTQPDIPTVRAASNMKVFQYMRSGTVPVVSNVGDLASYVKDGQGSKQIGLVVPPDDPDALAHTLVTILKDKRLRRRMAEGARKAAETDYALATLVGRLDQFLGEHVNRGREKWSAEASHE